VKHGALAARQIQVPDRKNNLSSQDDHSREIPKEERLNDRLKKQATENHQFHITDLLSKQADDQGARAAHSMRTLDRILSHRDIQDVISATGSYNKIQAEMELISDYSKNPFYKLEADEEFIIVNYRLIKQKKQDFGGLGVKSPKRVRPANS
jgi:negative regulator of genetic competence, sporulation and motility